MLLNTYTNGMNWLQYTAIAISVISIIFSVIFFLINRKDSVSLIVLEKRIDLYNRLNLLADICSNSFIPGILVESINELHKNIIQNKLLISKKVFKYYEQEIIANNIIIATDNFGNESILRIRKIDMKEIKSRLSKFQLLLQTELNTK